MTAYAIFNSDKMNSAQKIQNDAIVKISSIRMENNIMRFFPYLFFSQNKIPLVRQFYTVILPLYNNIVKLDFCIMPMYAFSPYGQ